MISTSFSHESILRKPSRKSTAILIGILAVSLFSIFSYMILGVQFKLNEFVLLCICVIGSSVSYERHHDYLAPGFYFPILYFLFYWLGNFDFLDMYSVVPEYIWNYYILGIIAFYLGAIAANMFFENSMRAIHRKPNIEKMTEKSYCLMLLLFAFCFSAKMYMYWVNGIPMLSSNIDAVREGASEGFGLLKVFTTMLVIIPVFFFYDFMVGKRKSSISIIVIGACFILAILDGSRLLVLQMLVPMALIYILKLRRISLKSVLALASLGILFVGLNKFIRNVLSDPGYLTYIAQSRSTGLLGNIMISGFDSLRVGIDGLSNVIALIPSASSYTYGEMMLNSILSVLPGKQVTVGYYAAELLGKEFDGIGLATTLLGSLYIDGGAVGIFLGMLFVGFLLQIVYLRYLKHSDFGMGTLFAVYVVYFSIVALRTGILPTVEPILMFVLYWFVGWVAAKSDTAIRRTEK